MATIRVPLVAGNWKLNKTTTEAHKLVAELLRGLRTMQGVETVLCPPFTSLMAVSRLLRDTVVRLGAQNMHWEESGAYTGEVSPKMVAEFCQYVIVGHSERRQQFNETNEQVNRKVRAALAHRMVPIICVGETLEEYETGLAAGVISRQVREALLGIEIAEAAQLVVAYEPVWAIGTGRAASAAGADTLIRNVIRPTIVGLCGEGAAGAVRVLYGGSVDAKNAAELFGRAEIDGALVGGASLTAQSFLAIVSAAQP